MLRDPFLADVLGVPTTALDHVMREHDRAVAVRDRAERLAADATHLVGVASDLAGDVAERLERRGASAIAVPADQARVLLRQALDLLDELAVLLADDLDVVVRQRARKAAA